jgi:uncharacterized protein YjbK
MEDLWRVKNSSIDMKDMADLAEYHRYLDRFQAEEASDNQRNLLYGDAKFGSNGNTDPKGRS